MRGSSLDVLRSIRRSGVRRLRTDNLEAFLQQLILLACAAESELAWRKKHEKAEKVAAEAGGNVLVFRGRGARRPSSRGGGPAAA